MGQFLDRRQSVMDDFICRFVYPRRVTSDEIQNFSLRISVGYAAGLSTEILIRTVADVITKISEERKEWDQYFP